MSAYSSRGVHMVEARNIVKEHPEAFRVLVVEDEEDTLDALSDSLVLLGYEVERAHNGVEALARMQQRAPDVVVVDLMMPAMNGWDFHTKLRRDPSLSDTPVVAVSALQEIRAGAVRFSGYLRKPFEIDALAGAVEHALQAG